MPLAFLLFCALCVAAAPKDGVGLSKISLPSGPGSIEGLGDAFEPQLNSGTSAYSVKVAIPPGVNGLQPEVVLRYNAGSGNGPFGLAWSFGTMCIQRQTEKGLPTYGPSDVFTFQGEEMVTLSDGTYRTENESGFMRFRQLNDGWEIIDKSGRRYLLGSTAASRLTRPGGTTFTDTFKWCVEEVIDTHGNRMEYRYETFANSPGQKYCSEIRYSISRTDPTIFHSVVFDYETRPDAFSSFLSSFEIRTDQRCAQIRVLSQDSLVRRYVLAYEVNANDPVEPVAVNDAGLSFSLLRRVTQFDNHSTNNFLPPLQFAYTRFDAAAGVRGTLLNTPPYSLGNPNLSIADINCDSLPDLFYTDPFTGGHQVFYNLGNGAFSSAVDFISWPSPLTLDVPETQLADFDGDGRVDFIRKFEGGFSFYPNSTLPLDNDDAHPAWGNEKSFPAPFPPFTLDDPNVRTLDLDGDKRIDFFRTTEWGFIYYYNRTNGWEEDGLYLFGEPEMGDITYGDGVEFSEPGPGGAEVPNQLVKLADMNGDRLLDLVKLTQFGNLLDVMYWPNRGKGAWSIRLVMSGVIDIGTIPIEDVFVMDLNGDGLSDIVAVGYDVIKFWINQGNNQFSAEFARTGMPEYIRGQTVLRQADINGNGTTDFIWENWNPSAGAYTLEFYDFLGVAKANLLSTIDNGIGLRTHIDYKTTTDYYVGARTNGHPWHTRLPFPSTVVSKITRAFGLDLDAVPGNDEYVSELSYYDGYYDAFEKEFRGFSFAKKIERGDDRFDGIDVNSPTTVSRFRFHTGVPDGSDNNDDGTIDEFNERSGYEEEPIKGKVLWTENTLPTLDIGGSYPAQVDGEPADDAVVFRREINDWRIKLIHGPTNGFTYLDAFGAGHPELSLPWTATDGKRVSFAFLAGHRTEVIEANGALAGADSLVPLRAKKFLRSETDVDFFGNTITERNYGEDSSGSTSDDEKFSYSTYAFNLDDWLIGLPAMMRITDENGIFVSESRNYYDGAVFAGLPLGQVGTRGLMHREEQLVNGATLPPAFSTISKAVGDPRLAANYPITTTRAQYDAFGNLTIVRDPLYAAAGSGHEKAYTYDPVFHTYVEQETIRVGNGSADLFASATYDRGAGVMVGFTDFNGNGTSFQYDSFWRLVGIVKPGDTAQFPTAAFEYRPGDPFRGLYYSYNAAGNLTLVNTADPNVVNAVTTHQREVAGQAGTFDTMSFTDGGGHKLGTLHESDVAGQWIAKDFKRYSSQGEERKAFLPFTANSTTYLTPPETHSHVASFYDSANRVIRTVNPPEATNANALVTQTRTIYLPLETQLFDEEDINPASPYYNTPHLQLKDGLDRLIGVIETTKLNDDGTPSGEAINQWLTSYEYDLNDNLTHITDSQGNQKWFRYDGLKRKLFMNDPDRGVMTYAYDDASNLGSTLDARAQAITYTYDGVNRLLTEDYLDAAGRTPDVRYFYDTPQANVPVGDGSTATARNAKGMFAYVQDLSGEEHTSYDSRGRVEHVTKRLPDPVFFSLSAGGEGWGEVALVSYRTAFAYDSLDRVTTLTYPDSDQVGYLYNARNLLTRITGGPTASIITNITYRASDQLTQIDYGNGVRTTYDYDPRLRLNSLATLAHPMGEGLGVRELLNFSYEFDGVSNIKAIRDQRPGAAVPGGDKRRNTQLFQYDDLYRITRAQYSFALPGAADAANGFITYRYDRIGNMLNQSSDLVHTDRGVSVTDLGTMNYGGTAGRNNRVGRTTAEPGPHALTAVSNGNRAFPYDANGNMTVIDGLTNTWDFKDRLIRVEDTNMVARYTYDYTDRRVAKQVAWKTVSTNNPTGAGTNYVLYPDKYFEVRESDAPVKYVWNGNTRVARVTGSLTTSQRTQRLRVYPGMNLVSLAVTATNAISQLSTLNPQLITSARRWNPGTIAWVNVAASDTLAAGTVLWVEMVTNATLIVTGTYTEPANQALSPGGNFVAGWGLQPLPLLGERAGVRADVPIWVFDPLGAKWRKRLTGELESLSDVPAMLAPGDALFARPEVVSTLTVPESALQVRYYHQDHLGSSSVLTDAAGALVSETANYAFGFARNEFLPRNLREPYGFTQKERDGESGLSYFEARFLSGIGARFMSVDPLHGTGLSDPSDSPQRLHAYAYCSSSPLKFSDPTGWELEHQTATSGNELGKIFSGSVTGTGFIGVQCGMDNNYVEGGLTFSVKRGDDGSTEKWGCLEFTRKIGDNKDVAKFCYKQGTGVVDRRQSDKSGGSGVSLDSKGGVGMRREGPERKLLDTGSFKLETKATVGFTRDSKGNYLADVSGEIKGTFRQPIFQTMGVCKFVEKGSVTVQGKVNLTELMSFIDQQAKSVPLHIP